MSHGCGMSDQTLDSAEAFGQHADLYSVEQEVATLAFIREKDFADTFDIADLLLDHDHDLIHKAVGWMLREVGNRDRAAEENYLRPRYAGMPPTMLRYAIEKFPERRRQEYLNGRA